MITAIATVALAAILVALAARSHTFEVRRSTRIEAPREKIWTLIDDFHRWASWSPLEDLDPVMRRTYSEPAAGAGAVYAWKSHGRAGVGRMEIAESSPDTGLANLKATAERNWFGPRKPPRRAPRRTRRLEAGAAAA